VQNRSSLAVFVCFCDCILCSYYMFSYFSSRANKTSSSSSSYNTRLCNIYLFIRIKSRHCTHCNFFVQNLYECTVRFINKGDRMASNGPQKPRLSQCSTAGVQNRSSLAVVSVSCVRRSRLHCFAIRSTSNWYESWHLLFTPPTSKYLGCV